jgi:4-phytase/acid phosphatase
LSTLDNLLETCGSSKQDRRRLSLFEIPSVVVDGGGDRPVDVKGPLSIAGTFTEFFLLEYTEGMNESDVGWGCVDGEKLRTLIDLHTASVDFAQRTPAIARLQAANLLNLIQRSLEQAITQTL